MCGFFFPMINSENTLNQIMVEMSQDGPGWAESQVFKFYSPFLRLCQQVNIKDESLKG